MSDFEDGSIFTFEKGHQRELGDDLSPLNVALFFLRSLSRRKKRGNFAYSTSTT